MIVNRFMQLHMAMALTLPVLAVSPAIAQTSSVRVRQVQSAQVRSEPVQTLPAQRRIYSQSVVEPFQGPAQFEQVVISSDGDLIETRAYLPGAALSVDAAGALTIIPQSRYDYGHRYPVSVPVERGQISQIGDTTFEYDYRGRVSQIGDSQFRYDYRGRLVQVGSDPIDYAPRGQVSSVGDIDIDYRRGRLNSISDYATSEGTTVIIGW